MNTKHYLILFFLLLLGRNARAQEQAIDLVAGANYPIRIGDQTGAAKTRSGLTFGLLFRRKNEKGDVWSAGAEYQLMRNKSEVTVNGRAETQNERLEILHLRGCPLVWFLDKKHHGFVEAGVFVHYLLHEETELQNNLTNSTKALQRTCLGPSLGVGVQLGNSMRKSLIIGLRDDYGALSLGKTANGNKAIPLKFNTISLYVGLGI